MGKNVLIVTALIGFVNSFLLNDIKTLQKLGYKVYVAANNNHFDSDAAIEMVKSLDVFIIDVPFSSSNPLSISNFCSYGKIKKILHSIKFDLIHVHTPISGIIVRFAAKKYFKKGVKIIYTTHGLPFLEKRTTIKEKVFYFLEKHFAKYSSIIITINKQDYTIVKGFNRCNVEYIPGVGVDLKKFSYGEKNTNIIDELSIDTSKKNILVVGELSHRKNHILLLKALNELDNKEDFCVYICGIDLCKSGVEKNLIEYASQHQIKLHMLGIRKDINELAKTLDFGVITSIREGLGLSGIEMISCGMPLLGSDVQGIKDYIINGVNGFLFRNNDYVDLSKKIMKTISTSFDRKLLSKTTEKFDINDSIIKMEMIYKALLEE